MIEKIEDELSGTAKERWKEQIAEVFGCPGIPTPRVICMNIKRKRLLEEQVA